MLKLKKLTKKQLIIIISSLAVLVAGLVVALILLGRREEPRTVFYYEDFGYVVRDDGKLEIVSYSGSDDEVSVPTEQFTATSKSAV